jgi:hypothetical protein
MENIPALKSEFLMPNKNVYQASLLFSTKGWLNIHFDLLNKDSFYGLVTGNTFLKPIVSELVDSVESPRKKIKIISHYIKKTISWNGVNDFLGDPPKKVMELKSGTAGDINLLFGSMLAKAGFDVTLVLLSTRDNGFVIENFPSVYQFNYVVCLVTLDDKEILLDATDPKLPYHLLPEKCFNHKGFYISTQGYGWIGVEPIGKTKTSIVASLILDEEGNLSGTARLSLSDYKAHSFRKEGEEVDKLNGYFESKNWNIVNHKLVSLSEIEQPIIADCDISSMTSASIGDNIIFLNPNVFLNEEFNPFTAEKRVFPVDFGNITERIVILTISFPEGYIVDELPQNKILTLPSNSSKAVFSYAQNGNRITVTTHLQINKTLFMQDEYPALREFYARIVAKKSEQIVLKKKS